MDSRYLVLWFRHLLPDWYMRKHGARKRPIAFARSERGRQVIMAASRLAETLGVQQGMAAADARAIISELEIIPYEQGQESTILRAIAEWCIRYSPTVSIDLPDGLIVDATGCAHLWGGEQNYLKDIVMKFNAFGYDVRGAMAGTIGTAWAVSRYYREKVIIASGDELQTITTLPPAALRLEDTLLSQLQKLGFLQIKSFISMPSSVLKRRFGMPLLLRIGQALGMEREDIFPIRIAAEYEQRLPCLEPIKTATAITIAIKRLLEEICKRLEGESKGLRSAVLLCYRIDNQMVQVSIGTNRASCNPEHLLQLFELKIAAIAPGAGIELFALKVPLVEPLHSPQEKLWATADNSNSVAQLLDRITGKLGSSSVERFQPAEHYWPEVSIQRIACLDENTFSPKQVNQRRPVILLWEPVPIQVTAPIPDYPPMLFQYNNERYTIKAADGPERIEREWWINGGLHRDYYVVEDNKGGRFWIFRLGHYDQGQSQWFLHGFFA
ncbi:DNA polymerase Y family protein [[Flexibacter] sp. ATCC 35208]|uniref:Y-family DNA polymerase n=1 Tax=[Flexibacter] sp. ATCC 35208 TaxID=1936242 RepID=UPI0009D53F5D|nr:DNA polymerase Y family protein [[Flexibacter] sp. ATCC 35208]OMP80119.1 nucleotidyltransferase [[Flexibacter] sp. ATCC 35208]